MTRQHALRYLSRLRREAIEGDFCVEFFYGSRAEVVELVEALAFALDAFTAPHWPLAHRANVRRRAHVRHGVLEGRAIYCGETVRTYGYLPRDAGRGFWRWGGPPDRHYWSEPWTKHGPVRQNRSWHLADCPKPLSCPGCFGDHGREARWPSYNRVLDSVLNQCHASPVEPQ